MVARRIGRAVTPPGLKPQMESIVFLVAGWVTVKEMKAAQGLCVRTSIMAREQWMTRCGKIYRMTGRDICWKKKKDSCLVISKLNRAEHQHKKIDNFKVKLRNQQRFCDDCRLARKRRESFPACFESVHDDREGTEIRVRILVQRM